MILLKARKAIIGAVIGCTLTAVPSSADPLVERPRLTGSPQEFLEAVHKAASDRPLACLAEPPKTNPVGLAESSQILDQISGAAASTTGGLGKPVLTVTTVQDAKLGKMGTTGSGSLRWAVEQARIAGGAWIIFSPDLAGRTIRLTSTLRLPSNLTIDGGCSGIQVTAPAAVTELTISNSENIIITGLTFTKEEYDDKNDKIGDAIGITNEFDRVAILHNDFHRCGDGCVDIVRKERFSTQSRATIALNHFTRHNKVMLIGTLTCYTDSKAPGCENPLSHLNDEITPRVFVSVIANVFDGTSQRHPKVVSNAAVDFINNFVTLAPTPYSNDTESAVYGAATGTGGVLLADGNIFVNQTKTQQIGAGPITSVRSASGGGRELDGVVAAKDNITIGAIRVVEHEPALARTFKISRPPIVSITPDNASGLAACLLHIAGTKGYGNVWPTACDATHGTTPRKLSTHRP